MMFSSLFGILPHFYLYYLCIILEVGYLKWGGVLGLGRGAFHLSRFHVMIVFQWFCTHKNYTQIHILIRYIHANHLKTFLMFFLSSFLSMSPNVTKTASISFAEFEKQLVQVVGLPVVT